MGTVSFDFKDEVVVVTGGSRGLGLSIGERLEAPIGFVNRLNTLLAQL